MSGYQRTVTESALERIADALEQLVADQQGKQEAKNMLAEIYGWMDEVSPAVYRFDYDEGVIDIKRRILKVLK